jgi:hypothetical protein
VFHNLLHKDSANAESGALVHQSQQHIFPIRADSGHTPQIDDEFTMVAMSYSLLANLLQFVGPGRNELSLQDQLALAIVLDNGNPQHSNLPLSESNHRAKRMEWVYCLFSII